MSDLISMLRKRYLEKLNNERRLKEEYSYPAVRKKLLEKLSNKTRKV